jgi:uncharacterized protein YndB with AHSA1/START domain
MHVAAAGLRLRLERVLPVAPERVFAAFVEPDLLADWWGPAGFTSPSVELDLRPGGRFRIAMQPPDGELFHLRGKFREIEPPHRLAYTFEWEEPDPDDRETLVTLTFEPVPAGTRVQLDQGVFATEARYALHEAGWRETLDRLEASLAAR